jgi:hypothetical protein
VLTQVTDLRTKRLEKALKDEHPAQIIINVSEQRLVTNPECPHCRSDRIKRNGNLSGKIEKDSVLCSDGFRAYIQVASVNKMEHKQLNVSAGIRVIDNVFHIQNVNAYHQRLKSWIKRFHGVATKYLEHYLGWFRFLDTTDNPNENSLFEVQQHLTGT